MALANFVSHDYMTDVEKLMVRDIRPIAERMPPPNDTVLVGHVWVSGAVSVNSALQDSRPVEFIRPDMWPEMLDDGHRKALKASLATPVDLNICQASLKSLRQIDDCKTQEWTTNHKLLKKKRSTWGRCFADDARECVGCVSENDWGMPQVYVKVFEDSDLQIRACGVDHFVAAHAKISATMRQMAMERATRDAKKERLQVTKKAMLDAMFNGVAMPTPPPCVSPLNLSSVSLAAFQISVCVRRMFKSIPEDSCEFLAALDATVLNESSVFLMSDLPDCIIPFIKAGGARALQRLCSPVFDFDVPQPL